MDNVQIVMNGHDEPIGLRVNGTLYTIAEVVMSLRLLVQVRRWAAMIRVGGGGAELWELEEKMREIVERHRL